MASRTSRRSRGAGAPRRLRGSAGTLALALIALLPAGCLCPGVPPKDRQEAILRVNENLSKINQPLQYKALVSFKFRDSQDKVHRFIGHEASLLYSPPQALVFDVRSLAGVVAQFGSNPEQYWFWIDVPDARKLWWGLWDGVAEGSAAELAIPPDELLDALMLRPLPEHLAHGPLPLLRTVGDDHRLLYMRVGPDGEPLGMREVQLDHCEPYQPVEIVDRLPNGDVAMHATLQNHRRIGPDGPFTPRRYVVFWPQSDAEMRLDVLSAKFRTELPEDFFEFPAGWQGESQRLDVPARDPSAAVQEAPLSQ